MIQPGRLLRYTAESTGDALVLRSHAIEDGTGEFIGVEFPRGATPGPPTEDQRVSIEPGVATDPAGQGGDPPK